MELFDFIIMFDVRLILIFMFLSVIFAHLFYLSHHLLYLLLYLFAISLSICCILIVGLFSDWPELDYKHLCKFGCLSKLGFYLHGLDLLLIINLLLLLLHFDGVKMLHVGSHHLLLLGFYSRLMVEFECY